MYFARAVIMAVYGDHPAVRKSTLTGSACPTCFCPRKDFALDPPAAGWEMRNDGAVRGRKRNFRLLNASDNAETRKRAKKEASAEGVCVLTRNGWEVGAFSEHLNVFGPHPLLDNIFSSSPQVSLHGMDEGPVLKLCSACVECAIRVSDRSSTAVCRELDAYVTRVAAMAPSNSNAELQRRNAFVAFPWGITDFAKDKRRIDGSWWISMVRHLHVALCTTATFLPTADRKKVAFSCIHVLTLKKYLSQALIHLPRNALS